MLSQNDISTMQMFKPERAPRRAKIVRFFVKVG